MSAKGESVLKPTERDCPACGAGAFTVKQFPADTLSVYCRDCGNRCVLADLHETAVDARWFDE